jgi:hypothetical protein
MERERREMTNPTHLIIAPVHKFASLVAPFEDVLDDNSSGKKLFQYGIILNQIPVILTNNEEMISSLTSPSIFSEVEKDFPLSAVLVNADEWYEHLELASNGFDLERLSRDLFVLSPLAQEAFRNKHLYLPTEPFSDEWDFIRLAFFLSSRGKIIVSKPICYPAFVGIQKLPSSKKEEYRNPWTLLGVA